MWSGGWGFLVIKGSSSCFSFGDLVNNWRFFIVENSSNRIWVKFFVGIAFEFVIKLLLLWDRNFGFLFVFGLGGLGES